MKRLLWGIVALGMVPNLVAALELVNVRPCYGPLGAKREDLRCLASDVIYITYDIDGLTLDPKTGKASYVITMEVMDSDSKTIYKKSTPHDVLPSLGGNRMPGFLDVTLGAKQTPGKYSVKLSVEDRNAKETKAFTWPFEVRSEDFGFIHVSAPTIGFPGTPYLASFVLVNLGSDAKKQPNVDVNIKVLDSAGKPVTSTVTVNIPRDLPEGFEVQEKGYAPISYPLQLVNRPGQFTIDVQATDKIGGKTASLRFPLTVLDIAKISGK